uniref:F-box protein AT5G49610-like beta-propeller domain-containing protein n=1 Tax=Oryza punctata TaxID=4537 RepID=A0A0E0KYG5_ORYPU
MAPTAAAAAVAALSDDLLREVFLLLPTAADLVRASLACKPFLHAARNAAFLRRFRRLHGPLLLGCLVHHADRPSPVFVPSSPAAAAAAARAGGDFSLSFLPRGGWLGGGGGAPWRFLDCRNGRVLLKNRGTQELAVADPLARSCVSLPPPPTARAVGYGLVADDGDSSVFRVFCIAQDGAGDGDGGVSSETRAMVLSSGELSWADVAVHPHRPNLAASRAMQANGSLYWTLEGGASMVALSTTTNEFSVLELPPPLRQLSFDVVEKGEEYGGGDGPLYLLTMRGFCVEVWACAEDGAGELTWTQVEKSVRFHKAMATLQHDSVEMYHHELDVVGVVAGVLFLRQWNCLLSIDLETMKLRKLSDEDCSSALIYPYAMPWPPSFLNPTDHSAICNFLDY